MMVIPYWPDENISSMKEQDKKDETVSTKLTLSGRNLLIKSIFYVLT